MMNLIHLKGNIQWLIDLFLNKGFDEANHFSKKKSTPNKIYNVYQW